MLVVVLCLATAGFCVTDLYLFRDILVRNIDLIDKTGAACGLDVGIPTCVCEIIVTNAGTQCTLHQQSVACIWFRGLESI